MYSERHFKAYNETEDSADEEQPIQPAPLPSSPTPPHDKLPELIIEKEPPPPNKRKIDEDFFDKLIKTLKTEELRQKLEMTANENVKIISDNENGETSSTTDNGETTNAIENSEIFNTDENGENIKNTEKN